jgi:ATP-dependent DNA ligase
VEAPPEGGGWLHEIKFDGSRLLAFREEAKVKLYTRNRNDWTERFPSIRDAVARLTARSAVLDLEAVILEPSGQTSFHALQQALGDGQTRRHYRICFRPPVSGRQRPERPAPARAQGEARAAVAQIRSGQISPLQ